MSILDVEQYNVTVHKDAESGFPILEKWENLHGQFHNLNGPALVEYFPETGVVRQQQWMIEGLLSRPEYEGAAIVIFDMDTGQPEEMHYYLNGMLHRLNGPAFVSLDPENGQILHTEHYRFGKLITSQTIEQSDLITTRHNRPNE